MLLIQVSKSIVRDIYGTYHVDKASLSRVTQAHDGISPCRAKETCLESPMRGYIQGTMQQGEREREMELGWSTRNLIPR